MNKPLATLILIALTLPLAAAQTTAYQKLIQTVDKIEQNFALEKNQNPIQTCDDGSYRNIDQTGATVAGVMECPLKSKLDRQANTPKTPQPVYKSSFKVSKPSFNRGGTTDALDIHTQSAILCPDLIAYHGATASTTETPPGRPTGTRSYFEDNILVFNLTKPEDLSVKQLVGTFCSGTKPNNYVCFNGPTTPPLYQVEVAVQHGEIRVLGVFTDKNRAEDVKDLYIKAIRLRSQTTP